MHAGLEHIEVLLSQGRYDRAEEMLREILGKEPEHATAHAHLAVCRMNVV
jgi:Tfp pilus assembly protein PilF